jgi:hypothetical protein
LLIALAAHLAALAVAMPASPWEFDEPLFFQALHRYDPLAHHPPPPGYPLFMLFAQLVRRVVPSDFTTLVAISCAASVIGFVLLASAFRNLSGDGASGIAGALLFYFSPAMLIHSTLPISEPGALALLAAALYFATRACDPERSEGSLAQSILFALFAALTVGWRIQFSIFVVPLFLVVVLLMQRWRDRVIALGVFTATCVAWLIPLTLAVGGIGELIDFELGQGKYLAAHDAAESRTGWTPARIAFRFIGRAWGTEWMALLLLLVAAIGFVKIVRKRAFLPLGVGAAVYIGVALWVMDPADGVRYAIPFVLATAFCAGVGVTVLARRFAYVVVALAAIGFGVYVSSLLLQRRVIPSPPVQAATFLRAIAPPNAVVLYELPLWPHATYFLREYQPHRVDEGLEKFHDRPDVPLFIYADGATSQKEAWVFRWSPSDAYVKLTRNHYRVTSIIPVPPERRYRVLEGIYGPEREQDGLEWRWMSNAAALQLPHGGPRTLTVQLGLPAASPLAENRVMLAVAGGAATSVAVRRGTRAEVTIDVPAGAPRVEFHSEQSFIPAEVRSMRSGDRRRLAVELYELRASPAAPAVSPAAPGSRTAQ